MATIRGTRFDNTLFGTDDTDNIQAYAGNDFVDGGAGNDTVNGNAGDDTVLGGAGNDTVYGASGNDTVDGGTGDDRVYGGSGDDVADGGAGSDRVYGGSGHDLVFGGEGADSLYGGNDNDTLDGGAGDDKVYGGNGNDVLIASTGNDTLNGGDGDDDRVVFSGNRADYSVRQVNATVVIITDADGNEARVVRVETFEFADVTQSFDDVVQPYVEPDPNDLFVGTDAVETFDGGAGDDTLTGDNFDDFFTGGDGVDTFDFSDNTTGVQVVDIGYPGSTPVGGNPQPPTANIVIASFDEQDILSATGGSVGVERMIGTDHADAFQIINGDVTNIDAGAGDDVVVGSNSDDTILGGTGNDLLAGIFGNDVISTGDGMDMVFVDRNTAFTDTVEGHGHDIVTDFDPTMDLLLVQYDAFVESFDPFANLTQTADGALLTYADDGSVLLQDVDVTDLNASNLSIVEDISLTGADTF